MLVKGPARTAFLSRKQIQKGSFCNIMADASNSHNSKNTCKVACRCLAPRPRLCFQPQNPLPMHWKMKRPIYGAEKCQILVSLFPRVCKESKKSGEGRNGGHENAGNWGQHFSVLENGGPEVLSITVLSRLHLDALTFSPAADAAIRPPAVSYDAPSSTTTGQRRLLITLLIANPKLCLLVVRSHKPRPVAVVASAAG